MRSWLATGVNCNAVFRVRQPPERIDSWSNVDQKNPVEYGDASINRNMANFHSHFLDTAPGFGELIQCSKVNSGAFHLDQAHRTGQLPKMFDVSHGVSTQSFPSCVVTRDAQR